MANTFTQIHIQAVFAVRGRESLIRPEFKDSLYKYINGIVSRNGHKLLAINGTSDHIHVFFGMRPNQSLSELMQDIKGSSSKWINKNAYIRGKFSWQQGYGAFSYSRSHVDRVIQYIRNQEQHHRKKCFKEEYLELLERFHVSYDERYLFSPVDEAGE